MSYALLGPPFRFQGTMLDTQKAALETWETAARPNFPAIAAFRRIQAQQLRKAAGVLEAFYAAQPHPGAATAPASTFQKPVWQVSPNGHFLPTQRDDHLPMVLVGRVTDRYQEQLGRLEAATFRMNYLRTQIESLEDEAQYATDAPAYVKAQLAMLDPLFNDPHYAGVLISTKALFQGQPLYRASPFEEPRPWERQNAGELLS
jgi:hypothetical protein